MLLKNLIDKYSSEVVAVLASIGMPLPEASVFFVDSGATNTQDAADGEHGNTWSRPFATLDYAVGRCTADQGDIILVAPGHAETLSGVSDLDIDVSGITIIGLGKGSLMPTFTLGGTDASTTIEINGDNITVKDIRIVGGDDGGTTVAIDIQGGSDYITLDGLVFWEPTATMEILTCITLKDKTDQCTIKNCHFMNGATGSNQTAIITESDEHDYLVVDNCVFMGDWEYAAIDLDAAAIVYPTIKNCIIQNLDGTTGNAITINASTVAMLINNMIATGVGNAYAVSDVSASFCIQNYSCEVATNAIAVTGNATSTDLS